MNTSIFKQNEEKQQQINAKLKLLSQLEGRELREIPDFEITDELRKRMKKLMWFLGELNDEAIYQIVCALYNNENIENQGDFFMNGIFTT